MTDELSDVTIWTTEYSPTEPEITEAAAYLTEAAPSEHVADRVTLAVVQALLSCADTEGCDAPYLVRRARAALVARERLGSA